MEEKKSNTNGPEKLFRSKNNRVLAGICGGIAEYLRVDPLIIRISWIAATLFAGAGIIAYIIAIFIIPENDGIAAGLKTKAISPKSSKQWGIFLIIVGTILFLGQIGAFHFFAFRHFHWQTFLALLLVSYGVYLIISRNRSNSNDEENVDADNQREKPFFRVAQGKMIGGICSGISEYFNMDVTIIRLIWVLATLASGGLPIVIYILALLVFPYRVDQIQYEPNGGNS